MSGKDSPQNVIDSYRKRQQMMPFLIGGVAVLLVAAGIVILIAWFTGPDTPSLSLFASDTPTPTNTSTPTPVTPTATLTPTETITLTPTPTVTFTPSGPQEYEIKDGDTCWSLAYDKFKVDLDVLLALNNFPAGTCPISAGQKILIPAPNQQLPTATPLPTNLAKGTKIQYTVQLGDTMALIATKFNTTVDAILKENNLKDANAIQYGQALVVPFGLATRVPTLAPTSTRAATQPGAVVTVPAATQAAPAATQAIVPTVTPAP